MFGTGQDARRQGLVEQRLGEYSARSPRGIEDLHSQCAGNVVASFIIHRHDVATRGGDVGRWFVEVELPFFVDAKSQRHTRHFGIKR